MSLRFYDCFSLIVSVYGPLQAHQRIAKYFPLADCDVADAHISLSKTSTSKLADRIARLRKKSPHHQSWGHPSLRYDLWCDGFAQAMVPLTETPHTINVSRNNNVLNIRIRSAEIATLGRTAVRIMRQFMIRVTEELGGREGHGAAVVINNRVLALTGLPGAGKSTVAVALASKRLASLMASDRLALLPDSQEGSWCIAGIPVPWRIADGTISGAEKLARGMQTYGPLYRGNELVEGKHELVTAELASMLAVGTTFTGTLDTIVVLSRSEQTAVRELHNDAKSLAIAETLFNPADQLFVFDWFRQFQLLSSADKINRGNQLAQTVRVLKATWKNYSDFEDVADQIAAFFD